MIASGSIKKALLLVGDKSASQNDMLFSDAATATAIEYDANAPLSYFDLNSDGSGYDAIILKVERDESHLSCITLFLSLDRFHSKALMPTRYRWMDQRY